MQGTTELFGRTTGRSVLAGLSVLVLVAGAQVLSAAHPSTARASSTLTTLAYEGFDYTSGVPLKGLNGGSGWTSAWSGDSTLTIASPGLTYPGLDVVGNTSKYFTYINSSNLRSLPLVDSGVVYFQFLSDFNASHGGGTPNIRLSASGVGTGAFGNNDNRPNMAVLGSDLSEVANSGVPISQLNLTIVRIDYSTQTTSIWVNPDLSTFSYESPPTPAAGATATGFAPAFDRIEPITREDGRFDEIKIIRLDSPNPLSGPAQRPADLIQQVGLVDRQDCSDFTDFTLNWAGVSSGGWSRSWALWANDGRGGDVCVRTLRYGINGQWAVS